MQALSDVLDRGRGVSDGAPSSGRSVRRPSRVGAQTGLLREFNEAGVLSAADVHVARGSRELAGEDDEPVALAVALAVRAPRLGHVFVDLATIRDTATVEPRSRSTCRRCRGRRRRWVDAVAASELVAVGEDDRRGDRAAAALGTRLYLDRYWREERRVAADLRAGSEPTRRTSTSTVLAERPASACSRGEADVPSATRPRPRRSCAGFAVVAGGPGTGKTTTVARIVALLGEQAAAPGRRRRSSRSPRRPARRPRGCRRRSTRRRRRSPSSEDDPRAAARPAGLDAAPAARLAARAATAGSATTASNRLPHDVVIVDETSMVSLSLMARLVEAVRADARLILVGDPGQLASIEAGRRARRHRRTRRAGLRISPAGA